MQKFSCSAKIKYDDYIRIVSTSSFTALESSFSFCYLLLSRNRLHLVGTFGPPNRVSLDLTGTFVPIGCWNNSKVLSPCNGWNFPCPLQHNHLRRRTHNTTWDRDLVRIVDKKRSTRKSSLDPWHETKLKLSKLYPRHKFGADYIQRRYYRASSIHS